MTFTTIQELRDYVLATFTANGVKDITGPEAKDAFIGILDLISPTLLHELTVNVGAGQVGGAKNNDVITAGTTIEDVLIKILRETVHPTYVQPVSVLSSDVTTLVNEIGTIISPTFSLSYTQNDGGALVSKYLTKDGLQISGVIPYQDANVQLVGTPIAYQGTSTFAQGACKNNNLLVQDCVGRIGAGYAHSNTITYLSYRKAFFGTPVTLPSTSANIRSLSGSLINPVSGSVFTIDVAAGTLRVVFAIPSSLTVKSVKYKEFGNCEVQSIFDTTLLNVQGANAYAAVEYRMYYYEPAEAFFTPITFEVTIL